MKRASEPENQNKAVKSEETAAPAKQANESLEAEMGEFEDPYGDDFESEDEVFEAGETGNPDDIADVEGTTEDKPESRQRIYIPHRSAPLGSNETMEPDYSTYVMLHSFNVRWPSLSFGIVPDAAGSDRKKFPHQMYLVSGTQASQPKENEINMMKLSSLSKTLIKDESDDENSDDDEDDDGVDTDPVLESRDIPTNSTSNRVRVSPFASRTNEVLAANFAENGNVNLWDLTGAYQSLTRAGAQWSKKPLHTVTAHGSVEGYALDWSPLIQSGSLLSGDVEGKICWTTRHPQGWVTDPQPFMNPVKGHSIEDLQWSPVEKTVFASTGSDGHVRIWDTRQQKRQPALGVRASDVDVNVMSWNTRAPHLLATGHDDGQFSVWDLRTFTKGQPVANFGFHKQAITSIEWNPNDESVLALGSEDSTVSLWDLSVEADDEEVAEQRRQAQGDLEGIPSQLLFLHWQPNAKEVHWHPQISGAVVSTGSDGFSVWKSISV